MSKAYVFLATGFEETEAIAAIDILRRGHVDVTVVSVSDSLQVIGRSRLTVTADCMFGDEKIDNRYNQDFNYVKSRLS